MGVEKIFGDILKEIRTERNLTQDKLAFNCQLDRTYISLLERGLRQPTITTLFKLSNALDITPNEFVRRIFEQYENQEN